MKENAFKESFDRKPYFDSLNIVGCLISDLDND